MASTSDVGYMRTALMCPVELKPLIQAVNLSPCNDKINEAAAQKHYGKIVGELCEFKNKQCVVCDTTVITYGPDHTMRGLAAAFFGYRKEEINSLPTRSLTLETKEQRSKTMDLPYPGKPAVFVLREDYWDMPRDHSGPLCRQIHLISKTEGSLLKEVSLLGYTDGSVRMSVMFNQNSTFRQYLAAHDILCSSILTSYLSWTDQDVRTLFTIVAKHNQIPAGYFNKMREIVEKGTCEKVEFEPRELLEPL